MADSRTERLCILLTASNSNPAIQHLGDTGQDEWEGAWLDLAPARVQVKTITCKGCKWIGESHMHTGILERHRGDHRGGDRGETSCTSPGSTNWSDRGVICMTADTENDSWGLCQPPHWSGERAVPPVTTGVCRHLCERGRAGSHRQNQA